jgi:nucleoside-diphosphate-sugar epimerase
MKNDKGRVGVIGATALVGACLLPLLVEEGYGVAAFSRSALTIKKQPAKQNIAWHPLSIKDAPGAGRITKWVCLAPIWVLPQYFPLLLSCGAKHVVAVSSTSRFTKELSADSKEKILADRLKQGEEVFISWAGQNNLQWTILRPTLIYGLGRDKNISVIAGFIRRFCFFPLMGEARGLRQPVHARDVALACIAALSTKKAFNRSYNISGGETLTYRQMVGKVFESLGKKPRFVVLSLWLFRAGIFILRFLPRFRHWSAAMAERMNQNLVFDHHEATNDFGFAPRKFELSQEDLSGT